MKALIIMAVLALGSSSGALANSDTQEAETAQASTQVQTLKAHKQAELAKRLEARRAERKAKIKAKIEARAQK